MKKDFYYSNAHTCMDGGTSWRGLVGSRGEYRGPHWIAEVISVVGAAFILTGILVSVLGLIVKIFL